MDGYRWLDGHWPHIRYWSVFNVRSVCFPSPIACFIFFFHGRYCILEDSVMVHLRSGYKCYWKVGCNVQCYVQFLKDTHCIIMLGAVFALTRFRTFDLQQLICWLYYQEYLRNTYMFLLDGDSVWFCIYVWMCVCMLFTTVAFLSPSQPFPVKWAQSS